MTTIPNAHTPFALFADMTQDANMLRMFMKKKLELETHSPLGFRLLGDSANTFRLGRLEKINSDFLVTIVISFFRF